MKILKAYANADATMNGRNSGMKEPVRRTDQARPEKKEAVRSGDRISLSDEARAMLEKGGDAIAFGPNDATYDQNGYVLRQAENVQSDLRNLASHLRMMPEGAALAGQVRGLQTQLRSIQTQI